MSKKNEKDTRIVKSVEPKPQESAGKKRGHYKRLECPYCHKHVGNLGNHIRQKHPTEPIEPGGEAPSGTLTKDDLVRKEKKPEPEKVGYHCEDCRGTVRKGEIECSHCGAMLNWEGIE